MIPRISTRILLTAIVLAALSVSGCNLLYKQNIQQGNNIDQEDLDQLVMGMTKNQVIFLLGTPAVRDPFHEDRWDYVNTFSRRGEPMLRRNVTLWFEDGRLVRTEGAEDELLELTEEGIANIEIEDSELDDPNRGQEED